MAQDSDNEKTEDPTPQRREDFRKRGQVAQSKEIGSVLVLFSVLLITWFLGKFFFAQLYEVFTLSFSDFIVISARQEDWMEAALFAMKKSALVVGPIAVFAWFMGVASTLIQVGFLNNEEALKFDPKKIDPIKGLQRIFSMKALFEGIKAILKVTAITAVVVLIFQAELETLPKLVTYEVTQIMAYIGTVVTKMFVAVGVFMLVLALIDFFFQKWQLEKEMRMTKQEVKEEHKNREGDPMVRARIRKIQREIANRRMMEDVPKADVIITNPTHIAVAIKYSADVVAPKIVAKGAGVIAEKIKELAKEHRVPVIENKPLARTIYKTLKIGQVIPRELYNAVAEVLSYVYRLKKKKVI